MTQPITIYVDSFWISPYAFTCFVALEEKKLEYTLKEVSLPKKEQLDPKFSAASVTGRVPAIEHGGFAMAESSAIVEYLEDAFPSAPKLLPEDVQQRARARQILAWIRSDLDAIRAQRSTMTMFYERAKKPLDDAGERAAEKLLRVASSLLRDGSTQLFDAWSIADADLSFMLHRLILNGHEVPAKVRAFAEASWERPSVRAFVEHARVPYQSY